MAKKCPKCEECPAGEKWAVPFADFLSLLLALFIALYALASVNLEKQKALKEEFVKIYSFADTSSMEQSDEEEKAKTNKESQDDIEGKAAAADETMGQITELEKQKAKGGNLEEVVEGTFMAIPAQLLFEQGKAELTNQYAPAFLSRIAKLIAVMPEDTEINVKGYAEESEVKNSTKYQDALELSTARANNVIRELIKYKISPTRLYSSGFGSSKAESLTDKRIVEFELRTMKETKTDDVDFDSIFEKMKK
jgi:chemotaxis protein MotB